MAIYRLTADAERFDALALRSDDEWNRFQHFTGKPLASLPENIPVTYIEVGRRGDIPHFSSHIPVLSLRAWAAVESLSIGQVQVFSLRAPDARYVGLNVFAVLDSVNLSASVYTRTALGFVGTVKRYAFKPGALNGREIFKVPETAAVDVLVSERFKEAVEKNGLQGFVFTPADTDPSVR